MSTNLTALIAAVNDRLSDYAQWRKYTGTGDGSSTLFRLDDVPVVSGSETVSVNSAALVEDTSLPCTAGQYYLDDESGWITFGTAPSAVADNIVVTYQTKIWQDSLVTDAINAGIDYIGGTEFYVIDYDDNIVTDSTNKDYFLPPDTQKVIRVEYSSSNTSTSTWDKRDDWELRRSNLYQVTAHTSDYAATTAATTLTLASGSGRYITIGDVLKDAAQNELVKVSSISTDTLTITRGHRSTTATTHASAATWTKWSDAYIHFYAAPGTGYLRVTTQKRGQVLSSASDALEYTAGLHARAKECIVLYSCMHLLAQRLPLRTRDDLVLQTAGENVITVADMDRASNRFRYLLGDHLNRLKLRPQLGRKRL